VTASSSGLDPHISMANAEVQASRVAKERGVPVDKIRSVVAANTERADLGFVGEPRVNVLMLNVALDAGFPKK
jgi:K+-transporting ATPase ATPase C chain